MALCGCSGKKSADGLYSGCTFVLKSGDYYNVGVEVHYTDQYSFTWDKTMDYSMHQLLDNLQVKDNSTVVPLIEDGDYYCTDVKRNDGRTWRTAFKIPESSHDEMISRLKDYKFTLTLTDKYSNVSYSSRVSLPVVDNSEEDSDD